jgi:uncharacterized protein YdaU (DUF1376 family)
MSWQAKGLYRELLDEYWAEGSLSLDHGELSEICGCTLEEFEMYWPQIKGCWEETPDGLANATMDSMRTETDSKRVTNAKNGKAGARAKLANAKQTPSKRQTSASVRHIEEKRREEKSKEEQKPSRDKREVDSRHVPFKVEIECYQKAKGVVFAWDGSDAKQLDLLLKSAPTLTFEDFKKCLMHRARSPGTPHGERPRVWLPNILKYQEAPLNEFGKTGVGNGNKNSKTGGNIDAARGALAILAEAERNSSLADEVQPEAGGGGESGDLGHLRTGSIELRE